MLFLIYLTFIYAIPTESNSAVSIENDLPQSQRFVQHKQIQNDGELKKMISGDSFISTIESIGVDSDTSREAEVFTKVHRTPDSLSKGSTRYSGSSPRNSATVSKEDWDDVFQVLEMDRGAHPSIPPNSPRASKDQSLQIVTQSNHRPAPSHHRRKSLQSTDDWDFILQSLGRKNFLLDDKEMKSVLDEHLDQRQKEYDPKLHPLQPSMSPDAESSIKMAGDSSISISKEISSDVEISRAGQVFSKLPRFF